MGRDESGESGGTDDGRDGRIRNPSPAHRRLLAGRYSVTSPGEFTGDRCWVRNVGQWLIHPRAVLPFSRASIDWRIGQRETS